jgi:hypothetical protein
MPTVGISLSQLHKVLSDLDLKRWKSRSWLTSRDPEFWDKTADVCGLYLNVSGDELYLEVVDERS